MPKHKLPPLTSELLQRINLVRRDLGSLQFHFTRTPKEHSVEVETGRDSKMIMPASASAVLNKILHEGALRGTSGWTYSYNCVCFTEAPIQEFNSISPWLNWRPLKGTTAIRDHTGRKTRYLRSAYEFAREEVDGDEDGRSGVYHVARWLGSASLDGTAAAVSRSYLGTASSKGPRWRLSSNRGRR
jgi:hypothetical protein